jgi:hypothetical protein
MNASLADQLTGVACATNARTEAIWAELIANTSDDPSMAVLSRDLAKPTVVQIMTGILAAAPYLQGLIVRDGARLQRVLSSEPRHHLDELIAGLHTDMATATTLAEAMVTLRRFKADGPRRSRQRLAGNDGHGGVDRGS